MIATNSLPTLDGRVATPGVLPKPVLVLPPLQSVKMLDQVRERIRYLHYSPRTEDVYVYWIRLFIRFRKLRHPFHRSSFCMSQSSCVGTTGPCKATDLAPSPR